MIYLSKSSLYLLNPRAFTHQHHGQEDSPLQKDLLWPEDIIWQPARCHLNLPLFGCAFQIPQPKTSYYKLPRQAVLFELLKASQLHSPSPASHYILFWFVPSLQELPKHVCKE